MNRRVFSSFAAAAALLVATTSALAHPGPAWHDTLASGALHPLLGWDHAVVMVAVGLWASTLGRRAMLALPLVFVVLMATGAAGAWLGVPLPAQDAGIAASAIVLGAAVALGLRAPPAASMLLVGLFAFFHGHAHGLALPRDAVAVAYVLGFVVATLALHALGIALGRAAASPAGRFAARSAGMVVAASGVAAWVGIG